LVAAALGSRHASVTEAYFNRSILHIDIAQGEPVTDVKSGQGDKPDSPMPYTRAKAVLSPTHRGLDNSAHHIKIRPRRQAYSGYGNQARKHYPTGTDCGKSEAAAALQGVVAE
jgi:hypothetical protein